MSKEALCRRVAGIMLMAIMLPSPMRLLAASHRTTNFIVRAASSRMAREVALAAETYRRDLALEWLGHELPDWPDRCPVLVQSAPNLPAGGETSFVFDRGFPTQWQMRVQGSRERVLDSVLPHEVTHTIFATHFGQPLPRWADEGACTTVEHESERMKQQTLLIQFLKTEHGIPFRHMFAMRDYPADILPLYSQGYSLTRFLISRGGKPKFIRFLEDGMNSQDWHVITKQHYGFQNLGDLQLAWLEWVRQGSPDQPASRVASTLVAQADISPTRLPAPDTATAEKTDESWYIQQQRLQGESGDDSNELGAQRRLMPVPQPETTPPRKVDTNSRTIWR